MRSVVDPTPTKCPTSAGPRSRQLQVAPGERMAMAFKLPLYVSMVGFALFFLALVLIATRTEIRARRLRVLTQREQMR